jgi:CrcB protein
MPPVTLLWVGLAGVGGVVARYALSTPFHGDTLPWITVAINVVGSFLLGLLVTAHVFSDETRAALGVGFLGGFTTFSTFSVQAVLDFEAGEPGRALLYIAASVVGGLAAAGAGYALGRTVL